MHTEYTETRLWRDLLKEGQTRAYVNLSETQEAYTVHTLQRFLLDSELIKTTLALGYLESQTESQAKRYGSLWNTADAGVLLAGLFPEQARKRNVSVSYFMGMSQVCFFDLAQLCDRMKRPLEAKEYREIGTGVERIVCVLHCVRRRNTTVHELLNLPTGGLLH
jgi:hypothetical protein